MAARAGCKHLVGMLVRPLTRSRSSSTSMRCRSRSISCSRSMSAPRCCSSRRRWSRTWRHAWHTCRHKAYHKARTPGCSANQAASEQRSFACPGPYPLGSLHTAPSHLQRLQRTQPLHLHLIVQAALLCLIRHHSVNLLLWGVCARALASQQARALQLAARALTHQRPRQQQQGRLTGMCWTRRRCSPPQLSPH